MSDDIHFYEPANGHGLPHDPFNAIVGPRPIGWISSHDSQGRLNLAPYSFFNAFNYIPPIIGFSSVGRKDSLNNIEQTGEFVWNLATRAASTSSCVRRAASSGLLTVSWSSGGRKFQVRRVTQGPLTRSLGPGTSLSVTCDVVSPVV
jgi:flavin reductase (DIM6/NTAB) family NADH-FMN oxidoreductase RutF